MLAHRKGITENQPSHNDRGILRFYDSRLAPERQGENEPIIQRVRLLLQMGNTVMKTATIKQLPSGAWHCRIKMDGKTISITKDTKLAVEKEYMALKSGAKAASTPEAERTLGQAMDAYIAAREGTISPTTLAGYKKIRKLRFKSYMNKRLCDMKQEDWQKMVNAEKKYVCAKTLKNSWGLVSSVITSATGRKVTVTLPQVINNDAKYLSSSDLSIFLKAIKGNRYEIAILLGLSGLRRSEIMGIRWTDIDLDAGCIYVRGASVMDENNNLVNRQENKNSSSRRCIPFILPQLREALADTEQHGEFVVSCYPNTINVTVQRICRQQGLPPCTCHGLRKSFASMMLVDLRQPDDVVMKVGGWSDPGTMRKIYSQVSTENVQKAGAEYAAFFEQVKQK